ncbi:MAG: acs, partial [Massilia sp.]|nr:acs [Massilia sp.]
MAGTDTKQQENQGSHENRVFTPPAQFVANAAISGMPAYQQLWAEAASDYEG